MEPDGVSCYSNWSVVIISNLHFSRSKGEYLRVVGILEIE